MKTGKNEGLKIKGTMIAVLRKADGTVRVCRKDNLIVDSGIDFICAAIGDTNRGAVMGYVAVGTDDTAVDAEQTALETELARVAATYTHTTGTNVFTISGYFGPGVATGALVEAGVCNAASSGTFLDRVVFGELNKEAADELTMTFQFTVTNGA